MDTSLHLMISYLDDAAVASADPDAPRVQTTHTVHTGRPGRPRIEICPDILATTLEMRGPTDLGRIFGTSGRTVRRRALEYGLVEPGHPVFVEVEDEDGTVHLHHTSSTSTMTDMSDEEIDDITRQIVEAFPTFGRRLIEGHFRAAGYRIPRSRQLASYFRVNGPPASTFGVRRIERRVYSVPGPNSLWHHDGQHGKYQDKVKRY
jgi:hypothetical protein